ncbi:MAG: GAF domain-containing protein [Myxococcales bacterium]|nr:GAF domain-containing protein [Myxococcales bacterium]
MLSPLAPQRGESNTGSEGACKLELLLDLGAMLTREVELDELLRVFGERVASAMAADRDTLWLVAPQTGALRSRVANLPELDELSISAGQGVVGHVAMTGILVNIEDASSDVSVPWEANQAQRQRHFLGEFPRQEDVVRGIDSERRI